MKLNQLAFLVIFLGLITSVNGKTKAYHVKPIYLEGDSSGKIVALVIEDALYKLAEDIGHEYFKKVNIEKGKIFQDDLDSGKLNRDLLGFLLKEDILNLANKVNLNPERLLLIYIVTQK